jgi:hypothetical protein
MLLLKQKAPVSEPARELIAFIAAGSSVEDVIAEVTRVQAERPGAQVQRGKRDSWEIWSAADQRRPA